MRSALLLSLVSTSLAIQLPFKVPFFQTTTPDDIEIDSTPRIAIVGAGAAGSSAAFWIGKAKERFGLDVEVDVYERFDYVGGRSTTVYPHEDPSLEPVELGASIFVQSNKNMVRASQEFNLSTQGFGDEEGSFGIWDGENVIVQAGGGWWDTLKLVWKYGIWSPRRVDSIVADTVRQFLTLYSPTAPKWDNISSLASEFGWTPLVESTASDYFASKGVSRKFTYELVEASTRVNYAQNIDEIHALEGAVSMAADKAAQIKGGNWKVFESFLKHSKANVYLNTTVSEISASTSSSASRSSRTSWTLTSTVGNKRYSGIILAAPFHQTSISLPSSLSSQIPEQPYIHLHVTLLTTTSPHINPAYLNLGPKDTPPSMLLTTWEGARNGGKEPEFNSVSYHGKVEKKGEGEEEAQDEWIVKIFSMQPVTQTLIDSLFGEGTVTWVYRKEWDAYPVLPPTSDFPPVKLDTGFYYVNAFEPFISTMETETIAARNVADLLLNDQFGSGICGARIGAGDNEEEKKPKSVEDGYVFGWDC